MVTNVRKAFQRVEGIDVARAWASLIMVQGHAYEMYVHPSHHHEASYRLTRLLGTLPLPSFLTLAGSALYMRMLAAERKQESVRKVRSAITRRGLTVALFGYAMQIAFGFVDGQINAEHVAWEEILRGDVLQTIGFSIVLASHFGLWRQTSVNARVFARRCGLLGAVALLLSVTMNRIAFANANHLPTPIRVALAPFVDVGAATRMPLLPLFFWLGSGIALATWLAQRNQVEKSRAGAPATTLVTLGFLGLGLALLATAVEQQWVAAGMEFSRRSWVIVPNALQLFGRATLVLALGALSSLVLPTMLRTQLVRIGQNSLTVYAVHMPLCFSALANPLKARFSMLGGTLAVAGLYVVTVAVTLWWSHRKRKGKRSTD